MKKMTKKIILPLAIAAILLPGISTKADYDHIKPKKVTKIISNDNNIQVGEEFELRATTSPRQANDDLLRWSIIGKKGIIRFEDNDRDGDEAEFVALKAGTTKVRCSIVKKGKKYSQTFSVKVKKTTKASTISRVGTAKKTVGIGTDFDLEVKKSKGLYDKYLRWSIADKTIVDFEDNETRDDEVELIALKKGTTTVTCTNTKTGKTVKYTIVVAEGYYDDDDD